MTASDSSEQPAQVSVCASKYSAALISLTMNRPQESPKLFGHNRRRFMQVAARHLRKQILCGGAQHSVNVARLLCQPSENRIPSPTPVTANTATRSKTRANRSRFLFRFNESGTMEGEKKCEELDFQSFASRVLSSRRRRKKTFSIKFLHCFVTA